MASSTFSFERPGSSSNPGSSRTQRWRSVNRTDSGATPGWASASAIAISRTSTHLMAASPEREGRAAGPRSSHPSRLHPVPRHADHDVRCPHPRLAGEARTRGEPRRLLQLVILALLDLRERVEPLFDPDVAGGAGADAAAVRRQVHAGGVGGD